MPRSAVAVAVAVAVATADAVDDAVPCIVVLFRALPFVFFAPCCAMLCHSVPWCGMPCRAVPCEHLQTLLSAALLVL